MSDGWIKLYRQIEDCAFWESEPFSRAQAWISLLLDANHREKSILFNDRETIIRRGQYLTSVRKLSEKWKWGKDKTLKFLRYLEEHQMITKDSDNHRTLITIVKYEVYQGSADTDKDTEQYTDKDTEQTQTRTQDGHKQNANQPQTRKKESKNGKIYIKGDYHFSDDEILQSAFNDFLEMRNATKHPMTERAIEILHKKLDKLSSDPKIQADILDQSVFHSWQDPYELKSDFVSIRNRAQEKTTNKIVTLDKRVPYPEDAAEDSEEMRMFDEDMARHPREDGWQINDDGYWIKRNGIV